MIYPVSGSGRKTRPAGQVPDLRAVSMETSDTGIDECLHFRQLFMYVLCQSNLAAGADEIMGGIVNIEILVSYNLVIQ